MNPAKCHILVINCGSSSLKYELFCINAKEGAAGASSTLCKGIVERIGSEDASFSCKTYAEGRETSVKKTMPARTHVDAFHAVVGVITGEGGVVGDVRMVDVVGHRVVHGGETYAQSVVIDDSVEKTIEALSPFAPLHNPANLNGIRAAKSIFKHCPHVAVFDTAFHQSMEKQAFMYALPYEIYKKHGIRRYGFHGTSHYYVSREAARRLGKKPDEINVITCHLGNGCSITAVQRGKSAYTTMGFTPLEGLMMGTRCGDIDPAILVYLQSRGLRYEELDVMMNKHSGLLGISGVSNDMRDIQQASEEGNERAELSLEMFALSARKHIGACAALMDSVHMLVFTAGVGQNDPEMRERICAPLSNLGMAFDAEKNRKIAKTEGIISADYSPVPIAVIETKEELQIALDSYGLVFGA